MTLPVSCKRLHITHFGANCRPTATNLAGEGAGFLSRQRKQAEIEEELSYHQQN
jgi:hypothetical protein